jgi:hypothetical protein
MRVPTTPHSTCFTIVLAVGTPRFRVTQPRRRKVLATYVVAWWRGKPEYHANFPVIVHSAFIEHTDSDGLTKKKRTNTSCARTAQKRNLEPENAKGEEQEG